MYFIDKWYAGAAFYVDFDGTKAISYFPMSNDGVNICGLSAWDTIKTLNGSALHTSSSLKINFYSELDFDRASASWGFKDFKVYLYNLCNDNCLTCNPLTPDVCILCPAIAMLSAGKCICKDKFYMEKGPDSYTHCEECHMSCKTCTGGASNQCSSCYPDFTLSSNYTCDKPSCNFILLNYRNLFFFPIHYFLV